MDKFGHCLTAYTISRLTAAMYQWSGIKPLPAAVYGTSLGMAFQTNIEVFDGFSSEWGFSYGDMIARSYRSQSFSLSKQVGVSTNGPHNPFTQPITDNTTLKNSVIIPGRKC